MAKLKKILKYICDDVHTRVCITYNYNGREKTDLVYGGLLSSIPWFLIEKEMIETSDEDNSYPIDFCDKLGPVPKEYDTGIVEDSRWDEKPGLYIYLKE